ncbi:hypothetical protein AAEX28_14960 [Lentisphaerota bacterium WC36G]|nr:hypothetical protein LJT99_01715 [Lentisphaerae bacterium WC36]
MSNQKDDALDFISNFYGLFFIVFHMITIAAFWDFYLVGPFWRWTWGLLFCCVPIVNSVIAFFGLIQYWEISWIWALAILIPLNGFAIMIYNSKENKAVTSVFSSVVMGILVTICFCNLPKIDNGFNEQEFSMNALIKMNSMSMPSRDFNINQKSLYGKFKYMWKNRGTGVCSFVKKGRVERIRAKRLGYSKTYDDFTRMLKDVVKRNGLSF